MEDKIYYVETNTIYKEVDTRGKFTGRELKEYNSPHWWGVNGRKFEYLSEAIEYVSNKKEGR